MYATNSQHKDRKYWACVPPRRKANEERKSELKFLLVQMARYLAQKPTLTSLAMEIGVDESRFSQWISWGELAPWPAAELTKRYELKRRELKRKGKSVPSEITLQQLAPSLFLSK